MHTEEQAKELWCPHVRLLEPSFYKRGPATQGSTVGHEPASVNRGETRCKDTNCIGSKCSQWRFVDPNSGNLLIGLSLAQVRWLSEKVRPPLSHILNDAALAIDLKEKYGDQIPNPEPRGYCGLAGKP
jgi:hypothetical protein